MTNPTKVCNKCGVKKPATPEYFHKSKTNKFGVVTTCKECRSKHDKQDPEYYRKYYAKNKEKLNADSRIRGKKYYQEHREELREKHREHYQQNLDYYTERNKRYNQENKEKVREYSKQHYEQNKEKYLIRRRERYQENREWVLEQSKRYFQNNKERYRLRNHRRLARKNSLPAYFTKEQWEECKQFFNNECAYCGEKNIKLTKDHFIPLTKNGEFTINNIIPACGSCNSSKHNRDFFEWYVQQPYYSTVRMKMVMNYLGYKELDENTLLQQLTLL